MLIDTGTSQVRVMHLYLVVLEVFSSFGKEFADVLDETSSLNFNFPQLLLVSPCLFIHFL